MLHFFFLVSLITGGPVRLEMPLQMCRPIASMSPSIQLVAEQSQYSSITSYQLIYVSVIGDFYIIHIQITLHVYSWNTHKN